MRRFLAHLLMDLVLAPLADYFLHGLPPRRIALRILDTVLFCVGLYLTLFGPIALRAVGVAFLVLAILVLAYDTMTVGRYERDRASRPHD